MSRPRVFVNVQPRMGSTHLPGRVLPDLEGRPMFERQPDSLHLDSVGRQDWPGGNLEDLARIPSAESAQGA